MAVRNVNEMMMLMMMMMMLMTYVAAAVSLVLGTLYN